MFAYIPCVCDSDVFGCCLMKEPEASHQSLLERSLSELQYSESSTTRHQSTLSNEMESPACLPASCDMWAIQTHCNAFLKTCQLYWGPCRYITHEGRKRGLKQRQQPDPNPSLTHMHAYCMCTDVNRTVTYPHTHIHTTQWAIVAISPGRPLCGPQSWPPPPAQHRWGVGSSRQPGGHREWSQLLFNPIFPEMTDLKMVWTLPWKRGTLTTAYNYSTLASTVIHSLPTKILDSVDINANLPEVMIQPESLDFLSGDINGLVLIWGCWEERKWFDSCSIWMIPQDLINCWALDARHFPFNLMLYGSLSSINESHFYCQRTETNWTEGIFLGQAPLSYMKTRKPNVNIFQGYIRILLLMWSRGLGWNNKKTLATGKRVKHCITLAFLYLHNFFQWKQLYRETFNWVLSLYNVTLSLHVTVISPKQKWWKHILNIITNALPSLGSVLFVLKPKSNPFIAHKAPVGLIKHIQSALCGQCITYWTREARELKQPFQLFRYGPEDTVGTSVELRNRCGDGEIDLYY